MDPKITIESAKEPAKVKTNGTPVQGVPVMMQPVVEASRGYRRRASDAPSRRIAKIAALVVAIASPIGSGAYAWLKSQFPTRTEWGDVLQAQAKYQGSIDERLKTVATIQQVQAEALTRIAASMTLIQVKLDIGEGGRRRRAP